MLDRVVEDLQSPDIRMVSHRAFPLRFGASHGFFEIIAFAVELGAQIVEVAFDFFRGGPHGHDGFPEYPQEGEEGEGEGNEADDSRSDKYRGHSIEKA